MRDSILTLEDVHFSYGDEAVLDGINLTVRSGAVTALMGPSGCGKSSLLAIIAGLAEPASGRVERHYHRSAMMFQDPLLLPWRSALANVAFALKADHLDSHEREARAARMLEAVGLSAENFGKFPRQLSGGMRQRVALARALVIEPDFLLLDEPFSALDTELAEQMLALVQDFITERSISALLVTHDRREAASMARQIVTLSASPCRVVEALEVPHLSRE